VCPISNQILSYVADLRLHPAERYIRHGVVCTLSSDDPGIFGNDGLSYDFWEAAMSWELGLAELKRLARNSIEYSAMTRPERKRALRAWEAKWKTFIDELNQQRGAMERLAPDRPR
jgi:adenosine deaminase CECR1